MKKLFLTLTFIAAMVSGASAQEFNRMPYAYKWLGDKEVAFTYNGMYTDDTCFKLVMPKGKKITGVQAPEKFSDFPLKPEGAVNLTYSPDSTMQAFTRANDLYVVTIADGKECRLTFDGTPTVMNGYASWEIGRRSGKLGLGTAYVTGFRWALAHDYDYVFEMDADFSHAPEDLPRLLTACTEGGADMSVGSRYCEGVNVVNWPMGRILMSYCASIYVRTVLGFRIYDSTAGFVCYSRKVLEAIDLDAVRMKGYGFQIELKYTAHKLGFRIAEVPVIFVNRKEGTSKMSGSIFGEAFWGVLALRFRNLHPASAK